MVKSIYKITNLINGNIYIGQSKNPNIRFKQHIHDESSSLIHLAIKKYGEENFSFEVIEKNIENYNEREKYWIKEYHCCVLDEKYNGGYNLTFGGEEPPLLCGLNNPFTTHTEEQVALAKRLIKETDLPFSSIAIATGYCDQSAIDRINVGKIWNNPNEKYPLRNLFLSKKSCKERWEKIAHLLMNTDLTQKEIALECGVQRSTVTMINNGQNGSRFNVENFPYPLREKSHQRQKCEEYVEKFCDILANTNLSYQEIIDKYGIGRSVLSNINNGTYYYRSDKYSYPIREYYPNRNL